MITHAWLRLVWDAAQAHTTGGTQLGVHSFVPWVRMSAAVVTVLALVVVSVGCAGPAATPPSETPSGLISAQLSEWSVELSGHRAPAGSVAFAITNNGAVEHEFLMIRTDMMADDLPVKDHMLDVSAMGGPMDPGDNMPGMSSDPGMDHPVGTVGVVSSIEPGATSELRIDNAAPGHYVIACDLAGHYEQGMRTDFTATP